MGVALTRSEQQALDAVLATREQVADWGVRIRSVERPDEGSGLAEDDRVFPAMPTSQVVWRSLVSGVDHLRSVLVWLDARQVFPLAQYSVLRGALVAAAQALWVVAPDDGSIRAARGLVIAEESFKRHLQWIVEAEPLVQSGQRGEYASASAAVRDRLGQVRELRESLGDRARLDTTAMVREALADCYVDPALQVRGMLMWRAASSDAHSLGWAMSTRPAESTPPVDPDDPLSDHASTGNVEELSEQYLCAYGMLQDAWTRFGARASGSG